MSTVGSVEKIWSLIPRRQSHYFEFTDIIESAYAMVEWSALRNRGRRARQWLADFKEQICSDRHRRHRSCAVCQFKSTSFPCTDRDTNGVYRVNE